MLHNIIGMERDDRVSMWEYIRNVTTVSSWNSKDFVIIPASPLLEVNSDSIQLCLYL